MTFDLLEEPWIPVADNAGVRTEVGLADALLRAHEWQWIDGEAPIVTAALYRLLLALAHRVYGPPHPGAWHDLWDNEPFPYEPFQRYLEKFGDRFDLFGVRPFLQTPALPVEKMGSPAQLVLGQAVGNNTTLFDHTTARDTVTLDAAVAARWVVTTQAYDPGGLKTPHVKDRSSERGLCNYFGTVVIEGADLKETLLLNMVVYDPDRNEPNPTRSNDRPQWEHDDPPAPAPDKQGLPPRGWTDLLTWPSRRILLHRSEHHERPTVDGVVITPGTRLRTELPDAELMAAFRQRMVKNKKGRYVPSGETFPVKLEELRGVWRHCRELLLPAPPSNPRRRPRTLDHVASEVSDDKVYTLRVFGQQLDPQGGVVHAWLQESIPAPVALLRANEIDDRVEQLLGYAVDFVAEVGIAVEAVEKNYELEMRAEHKKQSNALRQWYWPQLTDPFGRVLHGVGTALRNARATGVVSESELFSPFESWKKTVCGIALEAVDTWVWNLPRQSGRQVAALAQAQSRFNARLHSQGSTYDIQLDSCRDSEGAP